MAHVRKMALVDPRLLDKLHTSTKPPVDMTLRDLDAEMTNILDKTDVDVSEKVRLYNQALLRYNDMTKLAAAKPTPVIEAYKTKSTTSPCHSHQTTTGNRRVFVIWRSCTDNRVKG